MRGGHGGGGSTVRSCATGTRWKPPAVLPVVPHLLRTVVPVDMVFGVPKPPGEGVFERGEMERPHPQPVAHASSTSSLPTSRTPASHSNTTTVSAPERFSKISVALVARPLLPNIDGSAATESLVRNEAEARVSVSGRSFAYDYVHGPRSSNEELFTGCVRQKLLPRLMAGFNSTILAYGQTGSGKTYTMGSSSVASAHPGLIQHTVSYLFSTLPPRTACWISFIQVYCEEVQDLLERDPNTGGPVSLQHRARALPVPRKERVYSAAEVNAVILRGSSSRSTGPTNLNADSSRSHAIISLELELPCSGSNEVVVPKLHFVDLAGSERCKRAGTSGKRLEEGNAINKGLHALSNVVNALEKGATHVPYRDAVITRLLEDSLGGNSQTLVVACVSPTEADVDETINTLQYAGRMRQILNKPLKAISVADSTFFLKLKQLQAERKRLRTEEMALREKMRLPTTTAAAEEEILAEDEVARLREELRQANSDRGIMLARLRELEAASSSQPCTVLAERAVHNVVVELMQENLRAKDEAFAMQRADLEKQVVASSELQGKLLDLDQDLREVTEELQKTRNDMLHVEKERFSLSGELSSAKEELARVMHELSAAKAELSQSKDQLAWACKRDETFLRENAMHKGCESEVGEAARPSTSDTKESGLARQESGSRKREAVDLLEEALQFSRSRQTIQKAVLTFRANRAAHEAHDAEDAGTSLTKMGSHDGEGEAEHCGKPRKLARVHSAHQSKDDRQQLGPGVYDPGEVQKDTSAARSAFRSQTVRDGYGSIYKRLIDSGGPKRRATRRTPLHEVNGPA